MSKIYAKIEGSEKRILLRIECDGSGCNASIKPHPEIAHSGWTKCGWDNGPGTDTFVLYYCPDCSGR